VNIMKKVSVGEFMEQEVIMFLVETVDRSATNGFYSGSVVHGPSRSTR
jgi:hypothetical protein